MSLALFFACTAVLFVQERDTAYLALGTFAYALILWFIARACIPHDTAAEAAGLKADAYGARLVARFVIVLATFAIVVFYLTSPLFWDSAANAALQRLSVMLGLGYYDSALPKFVICALIPGLLLFALGTKPSELGLTAWREGSGRALFGSLVLPLSFACVWCLRGHASFQVFLAMLAHNFLSSGFSEEFQFRGMTLSHLRAVISDGWSVAITAFLFAVLHLPDTLRDERGAWLVSFANVFALNAPIGYFLGLIAIRARSIMLPALIHTSLHMMILFES